MSMPENLIIRCLYEAPVTKPLGTEYRKSVQVSIRTNHIAFDKFIGGALKKEIASQLSIPTDHFVVCIAPKSPSIISLASEQQPLGCLQDTDLMSDVFKTHRIWGVTVTKCSNPTHCLPVKEELISAKEKLEIIYTISGMRVAVDIDPKTTVAALKDDIAKQTGIPVSEQRLVYCGSQIGADDEVKFEGSTTLFSLGIRDGDRIHVVKRIPIGQRSQVFSS